jgi:hypothetical protein
MCKITHTRIYLSITDSTEMCHMTRLVFGHAFIVIVLVVTHIPHTLVIYTVTNESSLVEKKKGEAAEDLHM